MDGDPAAITASPAPAANPHVLWRQLLGLVFWVTILSLPAGGPVGLVLCLALAGLTFADAWKSGIYKRANRKAFLNISPMAWGIVMALLFVIAWPAYVVNRNKLRTIRGTDGYFWALAAVGALFVALLVFDGFVIYSRRAH